MSGPVAGPGAASIPSAEPVRRRGISLTTRLAATVLGVGFLSMVVATLVGVSAGQTLGRAIVDDALTTLRTTASANVAGQLTYYERLAGQLAGSPQASVAIEQFTAGVAELPSIPLAELRSDRRELLRAYQETYFDPLADSDETIQVSDILSSSPAALYLQANYSVSREPLQDSIAISDAGDGSTWSETHATFHPAFRTAVVQGGLLDLYLVDASSMRVVYSAGKAPDLGTSLAVGPFGGSVVARAAETALTRDEVVVTDLSYYRAEPGTPVGAAAAPVRQDGEVVGAVVLTYDGHVYTELLQAAAEAGAGSAAELVGSQLYLIGVDGKTRSDPQSYLADPQGFLDASVAAGVLPPEGRTAIETTGTTVLIQPADDATANAAERAQVGISPGRGMTGLDGLVTLQPLPGGIGWSTVAEVPTEAAEATVINFRRVLLFGSAVFLVALAFGAVAWAKGLLRPVLIVSDRLGRSAVTREAADGVRPMRIPDRSPVEFHRLVAILNAMGGSLRRQLRELTEAREQRVQVLQSMLPEAVAQRVAHGDVETLDEAPSASVVVVVVLGLGGLIESERQGDRRMMDELHAELDGIALEHGLDRVKVVGDSYYGACGHDRPYLDHAPRCVGFAKSVSRSVRALAQTSSVHLDTAIGINTGAVTVGMSGGARLVYDVWGPTVSTAHALARSARGGEIVITPATRDRLPEGVAMRPWGEGSSETVVGAAEATGTRLWAVDTEDPADPSASSRTEAGR